MVGVVENQPDFAAYIRTNGQTSLFLIDLKARSEMYASSQGVKDDILKFKTIMQGYCGSNSFRVTLEAVRHLALAYEAHMKLNERLFQSIEKFGAHAESLDPPMELKYDYFSSAQSYLSGKLETGKIDLIKWMQERSHCKREFGSTIFNNASEFAASDCAKSLARFRIVSKPGLPLPVVLYSPPHNLHNTAVTDAEPPQIEDASCRKSLLHGPNESRGTSQQALDIFPRSCKRRRTTKDQTEGVSESPKICDGMPELLVSKRPDSDMAKETETIPESNVCEQDDVSNLASKTELQRDPLEDPIPYVTCVIRHYDSCPQGTVVWYLSCRHSKRALGARTTNFPELAARFGQHAPCRKEWNWLAQLPSEDVDMYQQRLRKVFTFSLLRAQSSRHVTHIYQTVPAAKSIAKAVCQCELVCQCEKLGASSQITKVQKPNTVRKPSQKEIKDSVIEPPPPVFLPSCVPSTKGTSNIMQQTQLAMETKGNLNLSELSLQAPEKENSAIIQSIENEKEGVNGVSCVTETMQIQPQITMKHALSYLAQITSEFDTARKSMASEDANNPSALISQIRNINKIQSEEFTKACQNNQKILPLHEPEAKASDSRNVTLERLPSSCRKTDSIQSLAIDTCKDAKKTQSSKDKSTCKVFQTGEDLQERHPVVTDSPSYEKDSTFRGHTPQGWNGTGSFKREKELRALAKEESASQKLLIIAGPAGSGKKTLIQQVYEQRLADGGKANTMLCAIKDKDLAHTLLWMLLNWYHDIAKGPEIDCEEEAPSEVLEGILEHLEAQKLRLSLFVTRVTTGSIQSCIELLPSLFSSLMKSGVSLCLVAADSLLPDAFRQARISFKAHTIGNMGQSHAVAYLRGKLQARNIAVSFELSDQAQEQVHRICGGNAGLIGTLVDSIAICGEVDTAIDDMLADGHVSLRCLLQDESEDFKWVSRTAARLILQSSSRAIPTRLLQQKLGSDSSLSITVLVQKGVLLLREVSYFVSDLPKDVYGQLREQVACLPSKVYEKVWEEILAAEVIPAASKPLAPFETQTASATCSAMKMHLHGWIGVEDI